MSQGFKAAARRRALREQREQAKLRPILAPSEAQGAARFLGQWAQGLGGKPQKVKRARHALVSTVAAQSAQGSELIS
jgi:hypothetical protein